MKKSSKIYLSVIIVLILFYIASVTACFNNAEKDIADDFEYQMTDLISNISVVGEGNYVFDRDTLLGKYSSYNAYPYRVILYDDDFNEVGRTGAYVKFVENYLTQEEKYCFLGNYITEDIQNRFNSNYDKGYWAYSFSYTYDDSELIPVEIDFQSTTGETVDKIKLSNNIADYVVETPSDSVNFEGLYTSDYENKYYQELDDLIDSGEVIDMADESYSSNTANGEFYSYIPFSYLEEDSESFDDVKYYNILTVALIDVEDYTLQDSTFRLDVTIITFVFVALCAVILSVLYAVIRKYQLNSVRYAFTNAAAHELKTPIAVIENRCEFILEGVNTEKTNEYVNSIYKESLRMNSLLSNLLKYNKLVSVKSVDKAYADLSQILKRETEKYLTAAESRGITIKSDIEEAADIECNSELISLAIDNLISNAVKFSPEDSTVTVKLEKIKKEYRITVSNPFSGTLSDDVWDMLYVNSESRSDKSTGMGLPISKEIFKLHKYKYGFNSCDGSVEFYFIAK